MASATIAQVRNLRVLNSHAQWTHEWTIEIADGRAGRGAAPRGETLSIFEDTGPRVASGSGDLRDAVSRELVGLTVDQPGLDALLDEHRAGWGVATVFALSVAFHQATRDSSDTAGRRPRLLFNLLNGGLHAYTNPVVSDFTEILVLPRDDDLARSIDGYRRLVQDARLVLESTPIRVVGGNPVHDLGEPANDTALGLARMLLDRTGLGADFDLAVDASAGDWLDGVGYRLPVSGNGMGSPELVEWWLGVIARNGLAWVEDPFAETDLDSWRGLHDARPAGCSILGDNLTSTLPAELEVKADLVDGVLLKPDQNGTVTGSRRFAERARSAGLTVIASHRSIETDSPFLVHFAQEVGADAIKIGPYSDFSSILRTNELLREVAR